MIDCTFFLHTTIAINGGENIQDFEERSYIRSLEELVLFDQVVLLFLYDYILPFFAIHERNVTVCIVQHRESDWLFDCLLT
jgi:hypothetical protein